MTRKSARGKRQKYVKFFDITLEEEHSLVENVILEKPVHVQKDKFSLSLAALHLDGRKCKTKEVWHRKENPFKRSYNSNRERRSLLCRKLRHTCALLYMERIAIVGKMLQCLPEELIREIRAYARIDEKTWSKLASLSETVPFSSIRKVVLSNPPFTCAVCGNPTIDDDYCFHCHMAHVRARISINSA